MILVEQNETEFLLYDSHSDFVARHFISGINGPWKFMYFPRGLCVQSVFQGDTKREARFTGVISHPPWQSHAVLCMCGG